MFDHCALLFFLILLRKIFFSSPNKAKFFFTNIIFSSYLLRVCTILPDKCWWNQRWPIRMHLVSHSPMRKRCGLMGMHLVSHWPWRNRCWSIGMHLVSHWPWGGADADKWGGVLSPFCVRAAVTSATLFSLAIDGIHAYQSWFPCRKVAKRNASCLLFYTAEQTI